MNPVVWKRTSSKTPKMGRVFETIHKTKYRGFDVTVTNYPGSSVITWQVEYGNFSNSAEESRYENTVKTVKAKALERVDTLLARWAKESGVKFA